MNGKYEKENKAGKSDTVIRQEEVWKLIQEGKS